MTRNRLKKLETRIAAVPCRWCGQRGADRSADMDFDFDRLSTSEQGQLAAIFARVGTRCPCGRVGFDLTGTPDDELHQALALLRRAMTPTTSLGSALLSLCAWP